MSLHPPGATHRVLRCGKGVARRLDAAPPELGRVHSVFDRAVNIVDQDGRLLTLHGPGPLLAPFAAAIEHAPPWGALRPAVPVRRDRRRLFLGDVVIDWSAAALADLSLPAIQASASAPGHLWLNARTPAGSEGLRTSTGASARQQLTDGIRRRDAQAFVAGARGLIGLGEGLTPAGDDCLVGILAVLHRLCPAFLLDQPRIRAEVGAATRNATTAVGREFVLHALDGAFSEPVIALLTARSEASAERAAALLLGMGATSGADTMAGMRLALQALGA